MRTLLLALAAAAVVAAGAWLLLRDRGPSAPPSPDPGEDRIRVVLAGGADGSAPATLPGKDGADPARAAAAEEAEKARRAAAMEEAARRREETQPGAAPRRPVGPPPEGGAGEIVRADRPAEEARKVDALREKLGGKFLEKVEWRDAPLEKVVAEIAGATGVAVEIEGEGLADEPVRLDRKDENAFEVLQAVTMSRNLRFEITPEKVIVKR
jgi:hypothetical protein